MRVWHTEEELEKWETKKIEEDETQMNIDDWKIKRTNE
jgi:hypothetical protein